MKKHKLNMLLEEQYLYSRPRVRVVPALQQLVVWRMSVMYRGNSI